MCLRSSDPFYRVSYYIKWVTTSWTGSIFNGYDFELFNNLSYIELTTDLCDSSGVLVDNLGDPAGEGVGGLVPTIFPFTLDQR